jgi:hypothetical protein
VDGEPLIDKVDILTDALASLTLKREVMTMARQAARAVANPQADEIPLNIVMHNPTARETRGVLQWTMAQETAWQVEPAALEFQLQPGYRGVAKFRLKRYIRVDAAPLPILTAVIDGVGQASQPLILARQKNREVFFRREAQTPVVVDGAASESEWEHAAQFADFVCLGGGAPKRKFEARAFYDHDGIYLLARAEADNPATIATQATKRDGAVHHDESVEFFFDPLGEGRDFYQLAVNAAGVKLDRSSQFGLAWNPHWDVKVARDANGYAVEAFVPFAAFGSELPPAAETHWGFNVCRNDLTANGQSASAPTAEKSGEKSEAITSENIAAAALRDFGAAALRKDNGGATENQIVQWADTFGSNARSGCYGDLIFPGAEKQKNAPQR